MISHSIQKRKRRCTFCCKTRVSRKKFAYYDNIHVIYHLHDSQSSAASSNKVTHKKKEKVILANIRGLEELLSEYSGNPLARKCFQKTLSNCYFWQLGYSTYLEAGSRSKMLSAFKKGIFYAPLDISLWKTFLLHTFLTRCYAKR